MLLRMWVMMLVSFAVEAQDRQKQDPRKEAAIGAQMANEVRRGTTPLESPEVQSYVERIGNKLASQFTSEGRTYTFAVVTDSLSGRTHEPIALPGGYVFVSTSLLSAAQDEAGFAGIGHVYICQPPAAQFVDLSAIGFDPGEVAKRLLIGNTAERRTDW